MAGPRWLSTWFFNYVHQHNLIYNACWEDPRLDRQALQIGPDDSILVITSAGCNALDYALDGPRSVHAVDMNFRQNALLELKLAGIRRLDFERFFDLFGRGRLQGHEKVYGDLLRDELSPTARDFWDRKIKFFSGEGRWPTFYYYGAVGIFVRFINSYIDRIIKVRDEIDAILDAESVEQQRDIYDSHLREVFWTRFIRWMMGRDATLSLLGVPRQQRQQVEHHYNGGIAQFIEECVEYVFASLPMADNYFWRVYLTGEYTRNCCPEYLREENFERLKDGLADRVKVHTATVEQFLVGHDERISRFVLLDHMDWLSFAHREALQKEWQAICDRADENTRIIWRSGGLQVDYVDPMMVSVRGRERCLGDLLTYDQELAENLHRRDRVHTYGSFYIADLAGASA